MCHVIHLRRFFAIIVRPRLLLVELNFSENLMGDIEIPYICAIILELKDVLEKLHLNENGITLIGAQTLGTALARMQTMKVLRLNNNHIGTRGAEAICSVSSNPQRERGSLFCLPACLHMNDCLLVMRMSCVIYDMFVRTAERIAILLHFFTPQMVSHFELLASDVLLLVILFLAGACREPNYTVHLSE